MGTWNLGFAKKTIIPDITKKKYYVAGYLHFPKANPATGVVDDLAVHTICLSNGETTVTFSSVDCIGLSNLDILDIRSELADFAKSNNISSINICSTHSHSAIDTLGIWGKLPKSGRDPEFIKIIRDAAKDTIKEAFNSMQEGELFYRACEGKDCFCDVRKPFVFDTEIHAFHFVPSDNNVKDTYIVNCGAHPINMGYSNSKLSADFPYYIEEKINQETGANCVFFQGAIGGGVRWVRVKLEENSTNLDHIRAYGYKLATTMLNSSNEWKKMSGNLSVKSKKVYLPLTNPVLFLAGKIKLVKNDLVKVEGEGRKKKLCTEVGYAQIGDTVKIAMVPGELLPEVAFGGAFSAEEAINKTEYSGTLLKDAVGQENDFMVFGLANDEIGYIVPDNDYKIPIGFKMKKIAKEHYEELVSPGGESASRISKAFAEIVKEN